MQAHERGSTDRLYECDVYNCRHTSVGSPIGCMNVMFIVVGTSVVSSIVFRRDGLFGWRSLL